LSVGTGVTVASGVAIGLSEGTGVAVGHWWSSLGMQGVDVGVGVMVGVGEGL